MSFFSKPSAIVSILLVFCLWVFLPSTAQTQTDIEGSESTVGEGLALIPLIHLEANGLVSGNLVEMTVEQTFENRFEERIEAVYVFPLPAEAAVNEMVMVIGDRRIRADLQEREAARQTYEEARDHGQIASLLEQERPNIFTMNVANIQPGEPISVLIRYVEQLPYGDDRYHFHFPTVVGPRFIPGTPVGHEGVGVLPDTDRVPDASRITPGILPEGVRTPYEVDFNVNVEAGMAIRDLESSSHNLILDWQSEQNVTISLPEEDRQPNQDIVFSYALAADAPEVGLLTHSDERGGFFTLMVEPPLQFDQQDVRPKEMVFVLDCSGSMSGFPTELSKDIMRYALQHMNPNDTFQIIRFSDDSFSLSDEPLTNTADNIDEGLDFIDDLEGSGGTQMIEGIRAALEPDPDPQRMRIVLFLTDGYIGNESQIFGLVEELLGETRLFSLGVGSSVNRFLLEGLADYGRGDVFYVNWDEAPEDAVGTFYGRIQNPVLTDITVDWGGLDVSQVVPEPIPDVFAGTPLLLTGRFSQAEHTTVVIRGVQGLTDVAFPIEIDFADTSSNHAAIPFIWARRQVDLLERSSYYGVNDDERALITDLALEFTLLTQYTSFVAVEETISADVQEPLRTVGIPVATPEGVSSLLLGGQVLGAPPLTDSGMVCMEAAYDGGCASCSAVRQPSVDGYLVIFLALGLWVRVRRRA